MHHGGGEDENGGGGKKGVFQSQERRADSGEEKAGKENDVGLRCELCLFLRLGQLL